jgi:transglutaminase-like putative cysteine protease
MVGVDSIRPTTWSPTTIAIGCDYHDVPPARGTYEGGGTERLTVAVTVRAIE